MMILFGSLFGIICLKFLVCSRKPKQANLQNISKSSKVDGQFNDILIITNRLKSVVKKLETNYDNKIYSENIKLGKLKECLALSPEQLKIFEKNINILKSDKIDINQIYSEISIIDDFIAAVDKKCLRLTDENEKHSISNGVLTGEIIALQRDNEVLRKTCETYYEKFRDGEIIIDGELVALKEEHMRLINEMKAKKIV